MDDETRWLRPSAAAAHVQEKYGLPLTGTQFQAWCRGGLLVARGVPVMQLGTRYFIDRAALDKWIQNSIRSG